MQDINDLKDYFRKLIKLMNSGATFTFGNITLVKEQRINDIVCCIYAKLPENYKKAMKVNSESKKYKSMTYNIILSKLLKRKFFLDKQLCILKKSEISNIVNEIVKNIEKDIKNIEEHSN